MYFNDYQKEAMRTAQGMNGNLLANGAMGLAGETAELAEVISNYVFMVDGITLKTNKFIEEAGDCLWYLAVISEGIGIRFSDVTGMLWQESFDNYQKRVFESSCDRMSIFDEVLSLEISVGKCVDSIKKYLYQGHLLDKKSLKVKIELVLRGLAILSHKCNCKLSNIAENNVQKLKKRYPDGFSTEKSINRG